MNEFKNGDRVLAKFFGASSGERKVYSVPGVVVGCGALLYSVLVYASSTSVDGNGSVAGKIFWFSPFDMELDSNPPPVSVTDEVRSGQCVVVRYNSNDYLGVVTGAFDSYVEIQLFSDNKDCPFTRTLVSTKAVVLYKSSMQLLDTEVKEHGIISETPDFYREVGTAVEVDSPAPSEFTLVIFHKKDVPVGTAVYVKTPVAVR